MNKIKLLFLLIFMLFFLCDCGGSGGSSGSATESNSANFISGVKEPNPEGYIVSLGSYGADTLTKVLAKSLVLATGSISDDVPWVSQMPPGTDWANARHCGLASYIMVESFYSKVAYDRNNTPDRITELIKQLDKIDSSYQPIDYVIGNFTSTNELAELAQHNGFNAEATVIQDDALISLLSSNRPIIVAVYTQMNPICIGNDKKTIPWVSQKDCKSRGGYSNGHFVVLTKFDKDAGKVTINDPGRSWDQNAKNNAGKNDTYSISEFENSFNNQGRAAVVIWPVGEDIQVGIVTKTIEQSTATIGNYYSSTIIASGGSSSYTWKVSGGDCPPGITLKSSGELSGKPTKEGNYTFFVRVTDNNNKYLFAEEKVSITVTANNSITPVTVSSPESLPPAKVGTSYSYILSAIGGYISDAAHYIWNLLTGAQKATIKVTSNITGMPPGLSLDSYGKLSGTPTQSGDFTFTAHVNDESTPPQTVTKQFYISVFPSYVVSPKIFQDLQSGKVGTVFKQSGSGFTPNSTAILYFNYIDQNTSSSQSVGIDESGSFSVDYTIPSTKPVGSYVWWGQDASGSNSNRIYYTVTQSTSASNNPPIAEAAVSTSLSGPYYGYSNPLTLTKGQTVSLYFFADKDVNGDGKATLDPDGWTDPENGVASGGYAEWNTDLNQGTPTFEVKINNPSSAGAADIGPYTYTFNDEPGTYEYQVLRITDRKGAQSNVSKIKVTVVAPTGGGVYGILHDTSANGPGLSGATVTCGGKSTTTGNDGSFSLSGIMPGNQTLTLSKNGYQTYSLAVPISSSGNYNAGDRWLLSNTPSYEGWIDSVDCDSIRGWTWDINHPNNTLNVDIYNGNSLLTTTSASQFRQDLVDAGKGNGYHGFSISTPTSLKDGTTHSVSINDGGTSTSLSGSPKSLQCVGYASVSGGVNISANPVYLGQNFTISFTLKEVRGIPKTFDSVAIRVTDPNGGWFDFATFTNVTVSANGSKYLEYTNYIYTSRPTGTYTADARGKVGDQWFVFDTVASGVNPKSFSVPR